MRPLPLALSLQTFRISSTSSSALQPPNWPLEDVTMTNRLRRVLVTISMKSNVITRLGSPSYAIEEKPFLEPPLHYVGATAVGLTRGDFRGWRASRYVAANRMFIPEGRGDGCGRAKGGEAVCVDDVEYFAVGGDRDKDCSLLTCTSVEVGLWKPSQPPSIPSTPIHCLRRNTRKRQEQGAPG
ncbi:hypothetical protein BKA70DRAFT_1335662 [Coprinopsis sp. MPI-PUGE-AT-0042]|nr:hypothetical protein BKA70DRAFT_1335662 [Coprinopsis sp. MPI-PUGE-AT-0042]